MLAYLPHVLRTSNIIHTLIYFQHSIIQFSSLFVMVVVKLCKSLLVRMINLRPLYYTRPEQHFKSLLAQNVNTRIGYVCWRRSV